MPVFSYEVGAIFMIEDRATSVLERLGEAFGSLDSKITQTEERLGALGKGEGLLSGIMTGVRDLGAAIEGLATKAGAAGEAMAAAFRASGEAAIAAARGVDELTAAIQRAAAASDGMGAAGGGPRRGGGRRRGGGGEGATGEAGIGGEGVGEAVGGGEIVPFGYGWNETAAGYMGARAGGGGVGGAAWTDAQYSEIDRLRIANSGPSGGWSGYGGAGPSGAGGSAGFGPPMPPLNAGMPPSNEAGAGGVGLWEIAEAAIGWREYRLAMEGDLALRQSLEALNVRPEDRGFGVDMTKMRRSAQEATDRSIISEPEGQKMLSHFAGIMIGSGEMGMEQVETLFPIAARLAELSHQRSGAALGSEAVAGGEFAHLTGTYDPTKMGPLLDLINAISQRTNTTIAGQFGIQRYGMPMALAAGLTPQQAAVDIAFSELAMGPTTRAGTAYGQFLTASMTGGEAKTIQQHVARHRATREFEEAMRLEDPKGLVEHQRTMKDPKQMTAMEDLGLIDRATKKHLNLTPAGEFNEEFEKQAIRTFAMQNTDQKVEQTLKDAFGQIGFRYAQIFTKPDALAREQMLRGEPFDPAKGGDRLGVLGAPTVLQQQADLMQSPMQQFQQMIAQTDTILASLAASTLPAFKAGLEGINAGLTGAKDWLRAHPSEEPGIAATVGGFIMSGLGGATNWMAKAVPGMKGIAGRGLGSVLGVAGGLTSLFGAASLTQDVVEWGSDSVMDSIYGAGFSEQHRKNLEEHNPFGAGNRGGLLGMLSRSGGTAQAAAAPAPVGPRADLLSSGEPRAAAQPVNNITVHLGPVSMQGVPDDSSLHALLKKMTDGIKDALSHMTSDPAGTSQSPYSYPGPF